MSKNTLILLTDAKPGHETQAIGISKILNQEDHLDILKIQIQRPSKFIGVLFKKFYSLFPKRWMLKFFLSVNDLNRLQHLPHVDYIVSAGGDTLLPNALLKAYLVKQYPQVKNLIATSLRGMPEAAYDVVFTIDATKDQQKPYVFYPIAPNKMVSFDLKQAQQKAQEKLALQPNQHAVTVLLGADTAEVNIGLADEWLHLIKTIATQYPDQQFFVCSSRRTPQALVERLKRLIDLPNVKLVLFGQQQGIVVEDLIFAATHIICSPDSTSMLCEAMIANKHVIVPRFEHTQLSHNFQSYYQKMSPYVAYVEAQEVNALLACPQLQQHHHVAILQSKFMQALHH